jgi:hypothetical protein
LGQIVDRPLEINRDLSVFGRIKQFERFTDERKGYRGVGNRVWHDFSIYASEASPVTQAPEFLNSE